MVLLLCIWFKKVAWESKLLELFLPLEDTLVATFNETRAPTSKKYIAEKGIRMPNLSETPQSFWSHSSVFALENNLSGYFQ